MSLFSKKGPDDRTRQIIREIIVEYGEDPDDVRYNIYCGRPYTATDNEICVVGASAPSDDAFAFVALLSPITIQSRRIPWKLAMVDKRLAHYQKLGRPPLYDRICSIAREEEETASLTQRSSDTEEALPQSAFCEDDRESIKKILEQWRDGEWTDEELTSGLGVALVFGLRELTNQWTNGDISDDDLLSRVFLASDILLGNRKDLMK
ncbi:hypothetical protein [Roseinatronobacter sp.]